MRFMLIDDDKATRFMLQDIIEDYALGEVVESVGSAIGIDSDFLKLKKIDILIIDMLMPDRDGIQTTKALKKNFPGKIIMLSQVENKDMIGNAYNSGIDYYITKPLNRNEVIGVIRTVSEHTCLKNFVNNIENDLHVILKFDHHSDNSIYPAKNTITTNGQIILRDLGIDGECGGQDFLLALNWLEKNIGSRIDKFPSLNILFTELAQENNSKNPTKDIKTMEQRLRRTIFQAAVNIASIGIVDCTNPKFDDYASRYFDLGEIYGLMRRLEHGEKPKISHMHINSKKFIRTLYIESNKQEK
ncbi:DNA-binding domain-containing protein [Pectinatus sottacetonis]|uniref:DNA-binding domain-containing protein n=1 Tax=Pectinatus sottacetonis TaxID=1002795 RepID=UPI0018C5C600|nr:DNA-binding domain-containing protein [Pectinatus sottacetonis]